MMGVNAFSLTRFSVIASLSPCFLVEFSDDVRVKRVHKMGLIKVINKSIRGGVETEENQNPL